MNLTLRISLSKADEICNARNCKYFDLFSLDWSQEFRGEDDGRTHRHDRDRHGQERDRYGGNAGGNVVQQKSETPVFHWVTGFGSGHWLLGFIIGIT